MGRRAYGSITALQGISITCCAVAGPLIAGWIYDISHHYNLAFGLCVVSCLIAAIGIWLTPLSSAQLL